MIENKIEDGLRYRIRDEYFKLINIDNTENIFKYVLLKLVKENEIKCVVINEKFNEQIFNELTNILSISFLYNDTFDYKELYRLSKLRKISIDFSYKMAIDFSNFKELEEIDITWNNNLIFKGADSLKYLILRKYGKEIFELELPQSIEFLELIQGKLKSVNSIEQYQNLKALVLYAQPKMEEYTAIGELKNLEFLHIHGGQLKDITPFTKLKKLKWLVLENCKHIETLKPLMELDNLIGVQLVGSTKPLDGDKSIRDIKNKYEYHYPYKTVGQRLYKEL